MWLKGKIVYLAKAFADFLFPPICLACNQEIPAGLVCDRCLHQINRSTLGVCARCGFPLGLQESCQHCKIKLSLPRTRALGFYSHPLLPLIHAFKYQGKKSLAKIFGKALTGLINSDPILKQADGLVPIPLHPARLRERGFNQAELLGIEIAKLTGIPLINALRRQRNTKSQTKLAITERISNMQGAFGVQDASVIYQKKVILIDDVITTGATLASAAKTLFENGVSGVFGLVIARA
ncbi:MAG: ComF family protein [candidate division WOR-3 bacterium]